MTFRLLRELPIPTRHLVFQEFEHESSGARHIHLVSTSQENAFVVAFPTLPDTDQGHAHVLEHLALCGSQSYPVRDPFFCMDSRSLASFMNAFTYPHFTAYPFATTSRPDYFNLMGVYLDAVFNPTLDELDFSQEGWRFEMDGPRLSLQGIVVNEMKGALSDGDDVASHAMTAHLFPGTPFAVESGGLPLAIPELSLDSIKAFHASHYHPSRAVFMSHGNIPAAEIQASIEKLALSSAGERLPRLFSPLAAAPDKPRKVSIARPSQEDDPNEHSFVCSWILPPSADARAAMEARLLDCALFDGAASPMSAALESAGFGRPSQTHAGLDDSAPQMIFSIGMDGLSKKELPKAKKLIFDVLERVASQSTAPDSIAFAARDLEIEALDASGGDMPYGLRLLLDALPREMAVGDAFPALDPDPQIEWFRSVASDAAIVSQLARRLLDSEARIEFSVHPDASYFATQDAAEKSFLAAAKSKLSVEDIARIKSRSAALDARQQSKPDLSCLPKICPADVSRTCDIDAPSAFAPASSGPSSLSIDVPSNGVFTLSLESDVSGASAEMLPWLSLYAELLPSVGEAGSDHLATEKTRRAQAASFSCGLFAAPSPDFDGSASIHFSRMASGLAREGSSMADMLASAVGRASFDDASRVAYLVQEFCQNSLDAIGEDASSLALLCAEAPFCSAAWVENELGGPPSLSWAAKLKALCKTPKGLLEIQSRLRQAHDFVNAAACMAVSAGDGSEGPAMAARLCSLLPGMAPLPSPQGSGARFVHGAPELANCALRASSSVSHCSLAIAAPRRGHPDAACMSVLAELVTQGFLHRAVRESGGAYSGRATYLRAGLFSMSSYRDPRVQGTYADFEAAIAWAAHSEHGQEAVDAAIISVIKGMDSPLSPLDWAHDTLMRLRGGIGIQVLNDARAAILDCDGPRLQALARKWLMGSERSRCAFVGAAGAGEASAIGLVEVSLATRSLARLRP